MLYPLERSLIACQPLGVRWLCRGRTPQGARAPCQSVTHAHAHTHPITPARFKLSPTALPVLSQSHPCSSHSSHDDKLHHTPGVDNPRLSFSLFVWLGPVTRGTAPPSLACLLVCSSVCLSQSGWWVHMHIHHLQALLPAGRDTTRLNAANDRRASSGTQLVHPVADPTRPTTHSAQSGRATQNPPLPPTCVLLSARVHTPSSRPSP